LDGSTRCLPRVMKKKAANQQRIWSVYINLPPVNLIFP
jgi:hypothetical protein